MQYSQYLWLLPEVLLGAGRVQQYRTAADELDKLNNFIRFHSSSGLFILASSLPVKVACNTHNCIIQFNKLHIGHQCHKEEEVNKGNNSSSL